MAAAERAAGGRGKVVGRRGLSLDYIREELAPAVLLINLVLLLICGSNGLSQHGPAAGTDMCQHVTACQPSQAR